MNTTRFISDTTNFTSVASVLTDIPNIVGFQGIPGLHINGVQGNIGSIGTSISFNGADGLFGFQGITGLQKEIGFSGPNGSQGFQGNQGSQGNQGFQGPHGFQGNIGASHLLGFQTSYYDDATTFVLKSLGGKISSVPITHFNIGDINDIALHDLTNGRCYLSTVYVPTTTTISGVTFYQGAQGSYTETSNTSGVGLYSYNQSSGIISYITGTQSPDFWKNQSNTWVSKDFSSSYLASPGVYFIVYLLNSTTALGAPTLGTTNSLLNSGNLEKFFFQNAVQIAGISNTTYTNFPSSLNIGTNGDMGYGAYNDRGFFTIY